MALTKEDAGMIVQDYRLAKNKEEQIKIMSQLYAISTAEIRGILYRAGEYKVGEKEIRQALERLQKGGKNNSLGGLRLWFAAFKDCTSKQARRILLDYRDKPWGERIPDEEFTKALNKDREDREDMAAGTEPRDITEVKSLPELEEKPRVYACDAAKNETCPKTGCYINGGPCEHTTNPECRKETKNLTELELTWWVNHLFNIAKEQAFNARQMEDALEIQDAQLEIVKTLQERKTEGPEHEPEKPAEKPTVTPKFCAEEQRLIIYGLTRLYIEKEQEWQKMKEYAEEKRRKFEEAEAEYKAAKEAEDLAAASMADLEALIGRLQAEEPEQKADDLSEQLWAELSGEK